MTTVESFSAEALIVTASVIVFLLIFNQHFDFELFTQAQRLIYLSVAVIGSIITYFGVSFLLGVRATDFR